MERSWNSLIRVQIGGIASQQTCFSSSPTVVLQT